MRFLVRQHDGTEADIDLATAVEWIRSGQLAPDSSVFDSAEHRWRRADTLSKLEEAFEAAAVEKTKEPTRVARASAHEFVDLISKLVYGAMALTVPIALGIILISLVLSGAVAQSVESLMAGLSAFALIVMTPYLVSVLFRRLNEDAYARTYGAALERTGHTAEPIRTAVAAFAIHRSRYQLVTTSLVLTAALVHFYTVRSDAASTRFTVTLALVAVILMIIRGYALEWRIAHGLFGTNAYEARELIEFVLHKSRANNISGLGTRPFAIAEEEPIVLADRAPQVQS